VCGLLPLQLVTTLHERVRHDAALWQWLLGGRPLACYRIWCMPSPHCNGGKVTGIFGPGSRLGGTSAERSSLCCTIDECVIYFIYTFDMLIARFCSLGLSMPQAPMACKASYGNGRVLAHNTQGVCGYPSKAHCGMQVHVVRLGTLAAVGMLPFGTCLHW
jgi:hypothetical protein